VVVVAEHELVTVLVTVNGDDVVGGFDETEWARSAEMWLWRL
jgi:hypothetical protein